MMHWEWLLQQEQHHHQVHLHDALLGEVVANAAIAAAAAFARCNQMLNRCDQMRSHAITCDQMHRQMHHGSGGIQCGSVAIFARCNQMLIKCDQRQSDASQMHGQMHPGWVSGGGLRVRGRGAVAILVRCNQMLIRYDQMRSDAVSCNGNNRRCKTTFQICKQNTYYIQSKCHCCSRKLRLLLRITPHPP